MDTTSYLALARQVTLQRHMATLATNIANATTSGYRAQHTVFEQVLQRAGDAGQLAFVQDVALARDLSPGPVEQTGNPLDVALDGSGYLGFATPAGTRYGRSGRLELDAEGRLVGPEGHPVLDDGGNPITLPADDLPVTATNKVIKRHLTAQAARIPHGILWERAPRSRSYRSVSRTGPAH